MDLRLWVEFDAPCEKPIVGFFVKTPDGVTVYGNHSRNLLPALESYSIEEGKQIEVVFSCVLNLGPGSYMLSLGVAEDVYGEIIPMDRRYDVMQFDVVGYSGAVGLSDLAASCRIVS